MITTASFTAAQLPFPVVVAINVTDPLMTSIGDGEYVMFCAVLPGLYAPDPPDHCTPVATVITALKVAVALLPQTD